MNPETLRQLIVNCRRKNMRMLGFPREWTPERVRHLEIEGHFFTNEGAWEFVADKLADGHVFEEMKLDNPPGALAIVMNIKVSNSDTSIYVKIQLGKGNLAIGRSFHYSNYR